MVNYVSYRKLELMKNSALLSYSAEDELRAREECAISLPLSNIIGGKFMLCITPNIKKQIALINDLYETASKDLPHYDAIEAFNSATIEGAQTTLADTMIVNKTNNPRTDSERMVLNTIKAIKYLDNNKVEQVSEITNLWKIVVDGLLEGEAGVRTKSVFVGSDFYVKFVPPNPDKICSMMNDLVNFIKNYDIAPLIKASIIHFYFVYVHPFMDGNGRTARLLLSDYLIKNGYDKFRSISITSEVFKNISSYYKSIEACEMPPFDVTHFVVFYLNTIEDVLLRSLEEYKPLRVDENNLTVEQRKIVSYLSSNNNKEAYLTPERVMSKLKISVDASQADILLDDLVSKGFIVCENGRYVARRLNNMELF